MGLDSGERSLLVMAIQSGASPVVDALVELIDDQKLSTEQVIQPRQFVFTMTKPKRWR